MPNTLFFVSGDNEFVDELAAPYREGGWGVESSAPDAGDALERIAEIRPVAAIFCLDDTCYESANELAQRVLTDPRRMRPLMVFLGGDEQHIAAAKSQVSVGLFVKPSELPWVLKHLSFKG